MVVDADAVHLTDTDGADTLIQVLGELRAKGADVALTHVRPPVLALWRQAGLADVVGDDMVFATVREAVETLTAAPAGARDAPGGGPRHAHPIKTMRRRHTRRHYRMKPRCEYGPSGENEHAGRWRSPRSSHVLLTIRRAGLVAVTAAAEASI